MKVLLVEPPLSPFDVPSGLAGLPEPLALETVAAGMRSRHDVTILDLRLEERLDEYLQTVNPDVVGVGAVTANLHLAKGVLRQAKRHNPDVLTIIGGHHVTFRPQDAREAFVDVIVKGEGDYSAPEAVDAFEAGRPLEAVPGLVVNQAGRQTTTAARPLADLDQLPTPARDLVARYRQSYFNRGYRPIVSINTSRGCPNRCRFCVLWKMNGGKYRVRSAEAVVDEIATFSESFVDFIDDNSLDDVPRARRIAALLQQRDLRKTFRMYGRADTVAEHPDLIADLADAGLKIMLVGLEAVREDKLADWNKACDLEKNRKAVRVLQQNNVQAAAYFLVDPNFDEDDFSHLGRYVDEMGLTDPIFTVLAPFPGSDLYDEVRDKIVYDDQRLFDFFHTVFKPKLPLEEFYRQFEGLYRRAYDVERQAALAPPGVSRQVIEAKAAGFAAVLRRLSGLSGHHQPERTPLAARPESDRASDRAEAPERVALPSERRRRLTGEIPFVHRRAKRARS
jgi:radical SAM superfamily enzyme YgiQ (UPF0313 family)